MGAEKATDATADDGDGTEAKVEEAKDLRALGYKHRYLLWGVAMTFVDGVKMSGGLASVGETSGDLPSGGKTSCDRTSADEWREDERWTSKSRASGGGRQVAG